MPSDMPCVYRAANLGEADIVAAWLEERGVRAFVKDRNLVSVYGPLAISRGGIGVCVAPADADRARELLQQHTEERPQPSGVSPISVTCPECGETFLFSATQGGTVQSCSHCRAYLDVPDTTPSQKVIDSP